MVFFFLFSSMSLSELKKRQKQREKAEAKAIKDASKPVVVAKVVTTAEPEVELSANVSSSF